MPWDAFWTGLAQAFIAILAFFVLIGLVCFVAERVFPND